MALNVLILSQIASYIIILVLSFCLFIPVYLHTKDFNGNCLLFANGTWREDDGLFDVRWSTSFFCDFPIFTGIFLSISSTFQIYRFIHLAYYEKDASFLGLFLDIVFGILIFFLIVVSAMIITIGFIYWCEAMTERFPSCEIAAGQNITNADERIDTSHFYIEMGTAQFGAWGSFTFAVGVTVISILKLINNHQSTNIRVSMYIERQRLVNNEQFCEQEHRIIN